MKACLTIFNHWLSNHKHIKYIKFKEISYKKKTTNTKEKCYFHNIFTINPKKKKKQLTTYNLLWKRCGYSSSHKEKYCVHNIFTTLSQQIINDRLLLVVMDEQKSNLSCRFKLEPITINHLWFVNENVVKTL